MACVRRTWVGMDSVWQQRKLEARKMRAATAAVPSGPCTHEDGKHHFIRGNVLRLTQGMRKNWRYFNNKEHSRNLWIMF